MRRIGSAALLLGLLATTIWVLPLWATPVLAAVAAALAGGEVAGIAGRLDADVPRLFVGAAAAIFAIAFAMAAGAGTNGNGVLAAAIVALVVASGLVTLALGPPGPATLTRAAVMTMAPLYVGIPLGVFAWVQWTYGPAATTWLLAVIALSDSAQYYSGRAFGRRKLAPLVSPAKTVEGAIGGLVAAGAGGLLLGPVCLTIPAATAAGLAALLALFGMGGDLFESLIKRAAGVKDSSALIPGHGGVLDRIDSHLFAAPAFYLLMRYVV